MVPHACLSPDPTCFSPLLQHTGTIPSKTFREAVLHLTGYRHQGFYGRSAFMSSRRASMNDILQRVQKVEDKETEVRRLGRQRPQTGGTTEHDRQHGRRSRQWKTNWAAVWSA